MSVTATSAPTFFSTTYFVHSDWLGTERARSSATGAPYETATSLPFGDALTSAGGSDPSPLHFTGLQHDYEITEDHTLFRQYSPLIGRWSIPGPADLAAANPINPQSWNRYSYVYNSPLNFVDATGLCGSDFQQTVTTIGTQVGLWVGPAADFPCPGLQPWLTITNFACVYFGTCAPGGGGSSNTGGGGGGSGSGSGTLSKIKAAYCQAVPSGRVNSGGLYLGGVGSVGGSIDVVQNYNSGQVSIFATGGGQIGWNGGASLTGSSGLVYGLDDTNNGFSGVFKGANVSLPTPIPGVSVGASVTSGGGVTVYSATSGGSLAGRYGGNVSVTNTTKPANLGNFVNFQGTDYLFYLARRPCN